MMRERDCASDKVAGIAPSVKGNWEGRRGRIATDALFGTDCARRISRIMESQKIFDCRLVKIYQPVSR